MARASTYTWLSLDEWAMILGYNVWHFNSIDLTEGNCSAGDCDRFWFQYPFKLNRTSREELARAIFTAEQRLARYLNYNLMPDWDDDVASTARHYDPLLTSNITSRQRPKSLQVDKKKLLDFGVRATTAVSEGVSISRVDNDNDNYSETAQITVDISDYDSDEIRLYYPGKSGAKEWEIRPITIVDNTTIEFPIWLAVKPENQGPTCSSTLDPDGDIYIDTVDVYRVYNDDSLQAKLVYEPTTYCSDGSCTQTYLNSCVYTRDAELGYVVYNPSLYREPDKVQVYYYSGWSGGDRPKSEMDMYWKTAVAYFAAGLLDKEIHNYAGATDFMLISKWMEDMSNKKEFRATEFMLNNPFGSTTRGAYWAWLQAEAEKI